MGLLGGVVVLLVGLVATSCVRGRGASAGGGSRGSYAKVGGKGKKELMMADDYSLPYSDGGH